MKNTAKKLLVIMLAAFLISTALVACVAEPPVEGPEETPENSIKVPEKTEPPIEDVDIFENGITEYKVIRAQSASKEELDAAFSRCLSRFEIKVLDFDLDGLSYREIAQRLSRDTKSVDNAVQRIRRKLERDSFFGDISNS